MRTRSGAYVMFATLDDLEGRVELFVRDAAGRRPPSDRARSGVVVRGRVDHKGRGEMSLVVAEAEAFEPGEDELAAARAKAGRGSRNGSCCGSAPPSSAPRLVDELKSLFEAFPGDCEVLLEMGTREGVTAAPLRRRVLRRAVAALRAEIDQLLGPRALAA